MARTKGVNKSQNVREYLGANPKAPAKEVVEALAGKGIKVSENLVYGIKGAMKEKKQRKARVVKAAKAATASSNGTASRDEIITMIRDVKALAQRAGGYENLK